MFEAMQVVMPLQSMVRVRVIRVGLRYDSTHDNNARNKAAR